MYKRQLYTPDSGVTKRVVMALVEGVSLGSLAYQPPGPATGYVAFVAALLYVGAVAALPRGPVPRTAVVVADAAIVDDDRLAD